MRIAGRLLAMAVLVGSPAYAASLKITCDKADAMSGAAGPLTVTYDGDASGTIAVASPTISFSLPAKREVRTGDLDGKPHSVTGITAFGDAMSAMPDQRQLEACAAKGVQPEFKDDPDLFAMAVMACVKTTANGAPVKVAASVSVALVPGEGGADDVVVEIKRFYLTPSKGPGGKLSLDAFPGGCKKS